jgi:hypothetical protein
MTQAQTHAHGLVIPSPLDRWIDAMLRAFAELVLHAARFLKMDLSRVPRACHTDVAPQALPEEKSGSNNTSTTTIAANDSERPGRTALTSGEHGLAPRPEPAQPIPPPPPPRPARSTTTTNTSTTRAP